MWIVLGAIAFHLGLFIWLAPVHPVPKVKYVPPPNFGYKEIVYENPRNGEKTTYREITVSTKLADPKKLPPAAWEKEMGSRKLEVGSAP
jgi:hypothetical protein